MKDVRRNVVRVFGVWDVCYVTQNFNLLVVITQQINEHDSIEVVMKQEFRFYGNKTASQDLRYLKERICRRLHGETERGCRYLVMRTHQSLQ